LLRGQESGYDFAMGDLMKQLFLFVVATAFTISGNARAERWVIKNPHASLAQFSPLKTLNIGGRFYVVVNAPAFATVAELRTYGEAAFPDAKIVLPKELPATKGLVDDPDGKMAWHVKALQYEKLPAEFNGKGIVVAVVDTGMDYTHPALKDHLWTNDKEIPNNGIDDDHNGYVDDVHGWDFERNKNDPMDQNGHGTHCSGIIAASPNPENRAQGVAPGAKVMAVRVIGDKSAGFLSDAVAVRMCSRTPGGCTRAGKISSPMMRILSCCAKQSSMPANMVQFS
jgi:hypothetical protein